MLAVAGFLVGVLLAGTSAVWADHHFSDVPTSNAFHEDISWLVDNDIAEGYTDGTFRPTAPVSRQAAAAYLHRYNDEIEVVKDTNNFPPGTWFQKAANCPAGKRPIAGGGYSDITTLVMTRSYPTSTGWIVAFATSSPGQVDPTEVTAWVTCVPK